MKKFTFLFILFAFICLGTAQSQVIFDENFNYPPGDSIGAYGWSWNTGTTNTILVVTPGLTFSGYPLSGIGNACRLRNNGNDAYKNCSDSATNNSIYASFMVNVDSTRPNGDYFFALLPGSSTTNYFARFYIKDSSNTISFGVSKGASGTNPIVWSPNGLNLGTTYMVVIKYTFLTGSSTDDEVRAYIFTSSLPGTEPGSPTMGPATGTSTDPTSLGRVALRQGSATTSPTLNIDGIRIGRTWANLVTGVHTITTTADKFSLKQNYPNPFNPSTNIEFSLKNASNVKLVVYDMMGREVTTLVNERVQAGVHYTTFDAKSYSSGAYIYKMTAVTETGETFIQTKSMVLVK